MAGQFQRSENPFQPPTKLLVFQEMAAVQFGEVTATKRLKNLNHPLGSILCAQSEKPPQNKHKQLGVRKSRAVLTSELWLQRKCKDLLKTWPWDPDLPLLLCAAPEHDRSG